MDCEVTQVFGESSVKLDTIKLVVNIIIIMNKDRFLPLKQKVTLYKPLKWRQGH